MLSFAKFSILVLSVMLAFFQVSLAQFPSCSQPCIGTAPMGSCSATDNACLCANQAFVQGTYSCFQSSCSDPNDLRTAYNTAASMCHQAGVTSPVIPPPPKRTLIPARRAYPIAVRYV